MKAIKLSLVILLAGILFSSTTKAISDPSTKKEKLFRQVSRLIEYPTTSESAEISSVAVEFTLDEKGQVVVTNINGKPELVEYVKTRLESLVTRKMKELTGEKLYYRFIFKK
jgi:hypothetical protein